MSLERPVQQISKWRAYLTSSVAHFLLLIFALYHEWTFVSFIFLFLIEAIISGVFVWWKIILKGAYEQKLTKGLLHGLFFCIHFLFIHVLLLSGTLFTFNDDIDMREFYSSSSAYLQPETGLVILSIIIYQGVLFLRSIRERSEHIQRSYAELHASNYYRHIFINLMITSLVIAVGNILVTDFTVDNPVTPQLTNTSLMIGFFVGTLIIEFFVFFTHLQPINLGRLKHLQPSHQPS